jgi:hypothetical protein
MVVADALAFEGAGPGTSLPLRLPGSFAQCLLRALSCRLVTGLLAGMDATSAEAPRYRNAVRLACDLASDEPS